MNNERDPQREKFWCNIYMECYYTMHRKIRNPGLSVDASKYAETEAATILQADEALAHFDKRFRQKEDTPKTEPKEPWLVEALQMIKDHPNWSDDEIAMRTGASRKTMKGNKEYQKVKAIAYSKFVGN